MEHLFITLLDEAIELELTISDIYLFFSQCHPEDAELWWQLCLEERNHAALLRSGKDVFLPEENFPDELIYPNLTEIRESNTTVRETLAAFRQTSPSRSEAFCWALDAEQMSAEMHFQCCMELMTPHSPKLNIFQKLNAEDKEHIPRIENFMKKQGL